MQIDNETAALLSQLVHICKEIGRLAHEQKELERRRKDLHLPILSKIHAEFNERFLLSVGGELLVVYRTREGFFVESIEPLTLLPVLDLENLRVEDEPES